MVSISLSVAQNNKLEDIIINSRKLGYKQSLNRIKQEKIVHSDLEFAKDLLKANIIRDSVSADSAFQAYGKLKRSVHSLSSEIIKLDYFVSESECYYKTGDYAKSIEGMQSAYLLAKKLNQKSYLLTTSFLIANSLSRIANSVKALPFCKEAFQLAIQQRDSTMVIRSVNLLSVNYLFISGQKGSDTLYHDSILNYVSKAESYANISNPKNLALLSITKAYAFNCIGDTKMFIQCSKEAYNFWNLTTDTANLIATCNTLVYALMNGSKYDSALVYLKKIDQWRPPENHVAKKDRRNFYYNYYRVYRGLGKNDSALKYLEKWYQQDSIFNVEKNIEYQNQEKKFNDSLTSIQVANTKSQEKARYDQETTNLINKIVLIIIILVGILTFLVSRARAKKARETLKMESMLYQAELSALKAQMNPHFIFNALNSIQHAIVSNNTQDAVRYLAKFSKLIRNVLDHSIETLIPLETEIETLNLYLEIEAKRFNSYFTYHISKIEKSNIEKFYIPPMMIQPYIENAVWHGLMPKEGEKKLDISFEVISKDELKVKIEDNGVGRKRSAEAKREKKEERVSRSMKNIVDRKELLEKTHSLEVQISINDLFNSSNECNGTVVEIRFKFINPK